MTRYTVTSEIFTENDNSVEPGDRNDTISTFTFKYPSYMIKRDDPNGIAISRDKDDDIDVDRQQEGKLLIEHRTSTELQYVGLQVWRGALLLADYILSNPDLFRDKIVLELGAGVGLTSIVASFLARDVICTDIDVKGILRLIRRNVARNSSYIKCNISINELDFLNLKSPAFSERNIHQATVILAADVIYDETITTAFVQTLAKLLDSKTPKVVYIALEKRFVFTTADMETVAPMFEDFLRSIEREKLNWNIEYVKIDFPRYFNYNRVKHMILMKIQNKLTTE